MRKEHLGPEQGIKAQGRIGPVGSEYTEDIGTSKEVS